MGWYKVLTICCFSFFLSSCLNYYVSSKNGNYLPKKPKFLFQNKPYNLKKGDLINNESIYFSIEDTLKYGDYTKVFYLKFFKNGRCYRSSIDITKKSITRELNKSSYVGYYKIKNTNEIEMEFFHVKHKEGGWYSKDEGFIRNDTLFIKGTNKQEQEVLRAYIPEKIKGLKQTTDW